MRKSLTGRHRRAAPKTWPRGSPLPGRDPGEVSARKIADLGVDGQTGVHDLRARRTHRRARAGTRPKSRKHGPSSKPSKTDASFVGSSVAQIGFRMRGYREKSLGRLLRIETSEVVSASICLTAPESNTWNCGKKDRIQPAWGHARGYLGQRGEEEQKPFDARKDEEAQGPGWVELGRVQNQRRKGAAGGSELEKRGALRA